MNRGKIFKKNSNKNFKIKYGTIDNKEIKSIYINFSSWISLNKEYYENHNLIIKKLKKNIQTMLYNELDENIFLKKLNIVDLDIRESGLKNSVQTYMSLEINLYQKNNFNFKETKLTEEIDKIILNVENLLKDFEYFDFTKKKKILN